MTWWEAMDTRHRAVPEVGAQRITPEPALGTTMLLIAGGTSTTADVFAHALLVPPRAAADRKR